MATLRERLAEFFRRLASLPEASDADEALRQIGVTLDEVEDALSGISRRDPPPGPGESDGRMYPPQPDFVERRPDGSIHAITRGHVIDITPAGKVVIRSKQTGRVEFQK
jgi:hypothetical protein